MTKIKFYLREKLCTKVKTTFQVSSFEVATKLTMFQNQFATMMKECILCTQRAACNTFTPSLEGCWDPKAYSTFRTSTFSRVPTLSSLSGIVHINLSCKLQLSIFQSGEVFHHEEDTRDP